MHPSLSDLLGLSIALFLYPLIFIAPGFSVGQLTNVLSFRQENHLSKLFTSIVLSISIFPVIHYLIIKFIHISLAWVVVGGSVGFWLYHLSRFASKEKPSKKIWLKTARVILLGIAFWVGMAILIVDLKIDGELFSSLVTYDYVKHIAVTDAIARTGIAPTNPSFYPGEPLDLFYYYFWFINPALIDLIGGKLISPRHSVFAGVLWVPLGLLTITWHFVRKFSRAVLPDIEAKHYPIILSMLAVTGLDLIPILFHKILEFSLGIPPYLVPSIEWWNEQVSSWFSSIIWVPHHVSSFIATLLVCICLRDCVASPSSKKKWMLILLCSFSLSSAVGMSIWVSMVFICFLVLWFIYCCVRGNKDELLVLSSIGVISFLLVLPYVIELQGSNHFSKAVVVPSVRSFFVVNAIGGELNSVVVQLLRLLLLPINYLLEFGFFLLGGSIYLWYRRQKSAKFSDDEQYVMLLLITSVTICTFIKANIAYNDLGWRGFMFAQMVLLLYSAPLYLHVFNKGNFFSFSRKSLVSVLAMIMILLGVSANLYEASVLRTYSLGPSGESGVKLREMYEWIAQNAPKDAVIQHYPGQNVEYYHALYGHRQVLLADSTLGTLYGINDEMHDVLYKEIIPIYESDLSAQEVVEKSKLLGLDVLVVKNDDPVSEDSISWMREIRPVFKNSEGTVYFFFHDR